MNPPGSTGEEIVHRWEWRTFGSHLASAEVVFAGLTPEGDPTETEEIYLLGPDGVNVKIRFDLLDIKRLMQVDENRLELWAPVAKLEFPMDAADVGSVFDAWGLARPELGRDVYQLEDFLKELIEPDPNLEIVHAHKRRVRYSLEGCMSELTTLTANDVRAKTIAAETSDREAVIAARDALGMAGHVNMSYNLGLRCLLGMAPVRYAVIDIGTNSVKFHIGEQHPDGSWSRIVDRAEVTRLGEGLDASGEIQPEPMNRTADAVAGMVAEANACQALAVAAVGTAALRIASNAASVVANIRERGGVPVDVVSGEDESRLAYMAVVAELGVAEGEVVVFDTGGGSTQFTFGRDGEVDERYSLTIGAVSYTERFGLDRAVSGETLREARQALLEDLSSLTGRPHPKALVGMGGAMTNLTAVSLELASYDPDAVQGANVTAEEVERQIGLYASMNHEDRRAIVGLQDNRAPVILAGALVVSTVMSLLGQDSLTVSDRGLRHGLIRERFGLF